MIVSDLLRYALINGGIVTLSQTIYAEDLDNAMNVTNNVLAKWQVNRWMVYDLLDVLYASTGATSYTVGPTGLFVFSDQRPDKIDAAYARKSSVDTVLYPFMSREGYDRFPNKSATGTPQFYFYDSSLASNGTIYFAPVPDNTWELHVNAKASLGSFSSYSQTITLPAPYIAALTWNAAEALRTSYQLPPDEMVTLEAQRTLDALINSIAQVPQAVQPRPSDRAGIFSAVPPKGGA